MPKFFPASIGSVLSHPLNPSPFKPNRHVTLTIKNGKIIIPLSPGHQHSAIYTITNTQNGHQYVGATKNLKQRSSQYASKVNKFVPFVEIHDVRLKKNIRNLGPLFVDIAANPEQFDFGYCEVAEGDLSEAEKTRIDAKKAQGRILYNKRGGGGGLRKSQKSHDILTKVLKSQENKNQSSLLSLGRQIAYKVYALICKSELFLPE